MTPIACILCSIDPQTTSLLVPMAQATVIALPIVFRANIAAAIRRARGFAIDITEPESVPPGDDGGEDGSDDLEPPGGVVP
jgi:hypothetical protein